MSGFQSATSGFVLKTIAHFYETNLEPIEQTLGTDKQTWPSIVNFTRYIRNAAYHGDRVALRNPNAPAASWHHLEITPALNGEPILGVGRFADGDLLLLLKEFSDALDKLGVPLPS